MDVTFGEWLRRRRRGLDLTQEILAQRVGCTVSTIRKIEAGERRPSKELATHLASCLEIDPAEHTSFITFARAEPHLDQSPPTRLPAPPPVPIVTPLPPPFLAQDSATIISPPVFVVRERELAELEAALETARSGQGQILFVSGDAGSGKTALVQEFTRRAQQTHPELIVASGHCNAQTGLGDPYLPFAEVLSLLTGDIEAKWAGGVITRENAGRLWAIAPVSIPILLELGPDLIDSFVSGLRLLSQLTVFAAGLVVRSGASIVRSDMVRYRARLEQLLNRHQTGQETISFQQHNLFEQYVAVVQALAARQPLLLLLEDLHWAAPSSISLLFHLGRHLGGNRILVVGAYRPEDVAVGWKDGTHPLVEVISEFKRDFGEIGLDLDQAVQLDGRRFIDAWLDTKPNRLDETFRQTLFQHTGGHPLFAIELLRDMEERADLQQDPTGAWVVGSTLDWTTLSPRVEGVIQKRIGRLPTELRWALRVASVEGETFSAEVVARVQAVDEQELIRRLSAELVRQHRLLGSPSVEWVGSQPLSRYRFRHHVFQQYLYQTLDEVERVHLHQAVGRSLETLYGDQVGQIASQLAWHFQAAGNVAKALDYFIRAGSRACRLAAYAEAIDQLQQGLALLQSLPDTPERIHQKLEFQIALGNALLVTKGFAASEVVQAYRQARTLCQQIGETPQLFPVLHGLHRFYLLHGELTTARELGEQMLGMAQGQQDPLLLVPAHRVLETTLWFMGEFALAQVHLEQALALYDPQQHPIYVRLYGQDEGVVCLADAGCILWFLGYPDQAVQRSREAISLAEKLSHPFSLALAMSLGVLPHQFRREAQTVQEQAEVARGLLTDYGFPHWLAVNAMYRGWVLFRQEQEEAGIAQMRQGLAAYQATGAKTIVPYFLGMLVEGYLKVRQVEAGLQALSDALAVVEKNEERWCEAELYRLKGELLLKDDNEALRRAQDEAEKCFWRAIKVARQQGTKSLELRATVSLSRLWQQHGKKEEARQKLAEIYDWFTEGFDTVDLKEARALLKALS